MPFDVVTLAQSGVSVIVAAMATEAWVQVRNRLGRFFGRGEDDHERQALAELDEARSAVESASTEDELRDAQLELRGQLKTRLRQDPALATQFAGLVAEIAASLPKPSATSAVTQNAHADRGSTIIMGGRDVYASSTLPKDRL